jgi:ATP-binding cassette, subfamily B, bacterial PglK
MKLFLQQVIYLLEQDKRKLPFMVIIFLMSSILDLLGIGIIGPYIALLTDVDIYDGALKKFTKFLGFPQERRDLLIWLGYLLLSIFFVKTIVAVWINKIIVKFSERQHVRLISFLMSSYQSLPYVKYIKRNSAEYIYSIHQLSNLYANHVVSPLLRMVSDGIIVSLVIVFLAWQNFEALALLVGFLGIILIIYDVLFRTKMNYYGEQCNIVSEAIMQSVSEGIEGLKEIRILGKEKYFYENVMEDSNRLAFFAVKASVVSMSLRYLLELTMIAFIVALVLGTLLVEGNLELLLPTLSVFGVASLRLFPAANTFMQSLMQMRYGRNSVTRLFADVTDIKKSAKVYEGAMKTDKINSSFKTLTLKKVCFFYPDSKFKALNEISLEIRAGESIGFVGPSGSGKTTLLDTLLGLFEPQEGSIEFNGKNIKNYLQEWQSQVAYIPQQIFLIDGTLSQNVTLGINDNEIDELKLNESLRQARLSDLVKSLPQGINTILGERGIRFSGGQRQRVALARAFYHGRDVLVMDEATSALDDDTENEIVAEIERLKGKKTMIVIAHRLTTLKHCDRIYELREGKIINMGSYNKIVGHKN